MSLYWHRNERSSGHISLAEASAAGDDEPHLLTRLDSASYVVIVPGDDSSSSDELNAYLTRLAVLLSRAGKTLFLLISRPSERPSWRSTILRLLPFADFAVLAESNVEAIGTFLYDRVDSRKDELVRDLSLAEKCNRTRARIVICIGRLISTNCCFCIEGSPLYSVNSVIGSQVPLKPSISWSREVAFICGLASHVVKLEHQMDALHQTLVLGRTDPQTYLSADSYDAATMKRCHISQQARERRDRDVIEMERWQQKQDRISKMRGDKYAAYISRNNFSTKPNELPGSRGGMTLLASPPPSSSSPQRRAGKVAKGTSLEHCYGPSDVSLTYDLRNQISYTARARERDVAIITPAAGVVCSFDTRSLVVSRGNPRLHASKSVPGDADSFFDIDPFFEEDTSSFYTAGNAPRGAGSSTLYRRKDIAVAGLTERPALVTGRKAAAEAVLAGQACMLADS